MNKLKYVNYYIGYQEVPNEISLCINISDCPYRCRGCHSQYLWDYIGNFVLDDIEKMIKKYEGMLTCVCFMGGDQNIEELKVLLKLVKREYEIKTCVYSGRDSITGMENNLEYLDFIKIGHYDSDLGGLSKVTTNQTFYKVDGNRLENITRLLIK